MFYEPSKGHGLKRDPFKNLVVPRPIGWISSLDGQGVANLAPFSFYNAICLEPPIVVFGLDLKPDGKEVKDTLRNIEETHEFVVNLPTWAQLDAVLKSATHAPHGVSEFDLAGLGRLPSRLVKPPRVEGGLRPTSNAATCRRPCYPARRRTPGTSRSSARSSGFISTMP